MKITPPVFGKPRREPVPTIVGLPLRSNPLKRGAVGILIIEFLSRINNQLQITNYE